MTDDLAPIVQRARAGDLDAFTALVGRFQDFVYGLAYHMTHSFEDARDLAQDVFVRAFLRLGQLQDASRFPQWLRQMTVNLCLNAVEAGKRREGQSLEEAVARGAEFADPAPSPAAIAEAGELRDAVLQAIRQLPSDYGLPLTLYYLDGLSYSSVGEFLDLSPGAVKMRVHRARKMVREELSSVFEDAFGERRLPRDFPADVRRHLELIEREYDRSCTLLNPEALAFERDEKSGLMTAVPSEPLRYRNDQLGYIVTVNTKRIFLNEGGPFGHDMKWEKVEEMTPESDGQARQWDRNRRDRYRGSLPHFLHAWAYDRLDDEGFNVVVPPEGPILCRAGWAEPEQLRGPDFDLGDGGEYRVVAPEGRIEVMYRPMKAIGILTLSDGWVRLWHPAFLVGGNWGSEGHWRYRDGFGMHHEFFAQMHQEERARWAAGGRDVRLREVKPMPLLPGRRRHGIRETAMIPRGDGPAGPRDRLCLYVMPDGNTLPYWSGVAAEYRRRHPEEETYIELADDWLGGHLGLREDLKRGDFAPDLAQVPSRWLGTYIADDLLQPLDDVVPPQMLARFTNDPDLLAACRWRGKLYALPISSSVRALFCNARFVESAPRHWHELVVAGQQARDRGCVYGLGLELAGVEGHNSIYNVLWGNGADVFDDAGELALDAPEAIAAFQFLRRLVHDGLTQPEPWRTDRERLRALWSEQKVAMSVHTPWVTRWTTFPFSLSPFPSQRGRATWLNIDCLIIPQAARHQDAAVRLLELLYEDEVHVEFCRTFMKLPVTKTALQDGFFTGDRHLSRLIELMPESRAVHIHPQWQVADEALLDAVSGMLQGHIQPEEVGACVRERLAGTEGG